MRMLYAKTRGLDSSGDRPAVRALNRLGHRCLALLGAFTALNKHPGQEPKAKSDDEDQREPV